MTNLPLEINYVTEEIALKAERELGETPIVREEALEQFKKAIKDEPSLSCLTDDDFLLTFLRFRKFNVKAAMDSLKRFLTLKSKNVDIVGNFNLEVSEKLIKDNVFKVSPYRDSDGCPIMIISFDNVHLEETHFSAFIATIGVIELVTTIVSPTTQICGLKFIMDVKAFGLRHLKYMTPRYFILMAKAMTGGFPIRYKALHITNANSVAGSLWNITKFLLPKKMRSRYHFTSATDLKKFYDPALLPEEYGGALKYDNEFFVKILRTEEDRIYQVFDGKYDPR